MVIRSLAIAGAIAAALCCSAPSLADTPTTSATPAGAQTTTTSDQSPAATAPVADPLVCKHIEAPTGSRLGAGRTCKKKSEWAELERRARTMIDGIQHNGGLGNCNATTSGGGGGC